MRRTENEMLPNKRDGGSIWLPSLLLSPTHTFPSSDLADVDLSVF